MLGIEIKELVQKCKEKDDKQGTLRMEEDLDYGREGLVRVGMNVVVLVVVEAGVFHAPETSKFDVADECQPFMLRVLYIVQT